MKYLPFLLTATFAVGILAAPQDKGTQLVLQCQQETGFDDNVTLTEQTEVVKKFSFCIAKKGGYMNDDGDLLLDDIRLDLESRKNFDDEKVNRLMKECVVKKDTPGDTAFSMLNCFTREN